MKNKVSERQPTSAKELEHAIKEVWVRDMLPEYCRRLVESMPKRLEAVIKARGTQQSINFLTILILKVCCVYSR